MGWYNGLIMESFGNKMAVYGISAPIFRECPPISA